jgi:hypothetical protein
MPEAKEALSSGKQSQHYIENTMSAQRELKNFWIDSTEAEAKASPPGSLASQGHVHILESSSSHSRGQCGAQTGIFPPTFACANNTPILSCGLVLAKAELSLQNIILCFEYPDLDDASNTSDSIPGNLAADNGMAVPDGSKASSNEGICELKPSRKVKECWLQV